MTIKRPRIGVRVRRGLLLLAPLCALGCRGDGDRAGLFPRTRDPLLGTERIPPAGVPIPGKDRYGAAPRDPLFTSPTASTAGSPAKEPFRLTEDFTPAALTARGTEYADQLVIDDRRPRGIPVGSDGVRPAVAAVPAGSWEQLADELRRVGGKPFAPVKLPGGEYEFRCSIPLNTTGAMRQYTGTGATPLAAVTDVYEQVRADRK